MRRRSFRVPMQHQRKAWDQIIEHGGRYGLFLAPGVGKTLVAIRFARTRLPALVVCRRDDYLTWELELIEEGFDMNDVLFVEKDLHYHPNRDSLPQWVIITYDRVKQWAKNIKYMPFVTCIADESHSIRHWTTARTKAVIRATKHIPNRIAMTGTPIGNDPGNDLFPQAMFIDGGRTFGGDWWSFRKRYYMQAEHGGWYIRRGAKREITSKLKSIAMFIEEDDVMTLPPVRKLVKAAKMSAKQIKATTEIIKNWEVEVENEIVELNQVISQLAKLRQVASGFVYNKENEAEWMPSGKLNLLLSLFKRGEILHEKKKVVIWCAHTAEIKQIHDELTKAKIGSVIFCGSNAKKKREARLRFKNDKSVRVFIGQADSGVGMNELIVSDVAVYFSNSFKSVSRQQSMRRIRRRGSGIHKTILYIDLVTEASVDEDIVKKLERCQDYAMSVLNELKVGTALSTILKSKRMVA